MFLPVTMEEMKERGWQQADFVLVTGDAYVDHHSFGTAIIGRLLERYGYKVAVLPQPDYKSAEDFQRFGKPRLGFLINSGVVDSMVNNYSVFKHRRKTDEYPPGGKAGNRPDRAVIVYSNRAKEAYKDVPVIIGGIEASLRRLGHYDYWSDKVRRSILLDSKADLLIYGIRIFFCQCHCRYAVIVFELHCEASGVSLLIRRYIIKGRKHLKAFLSCTFRY